MVVTVASGLSASPVSGAHLFNTQRWTAERSPYILETDVVIEDDTHLIIEPGVEVRAGRAVRIVVEGELDVLGTPEDPVLFTVHQSHDEYWGGIRFVFIDRNNQSSVTGAVIERAEIGLRPGSAIVEVSDSTFRTNLVGVEFDNPVADLTVQGSVFENNRVAVTGRTNNVITLTGNDFWNNPTTLLPKPQRLYDCGPDDGIWNIYSNDILRGPVNSNFYSNDVRTPQGSAASGYRVLASGNWWGTADEERVAGRMRAEFDCCPSPFVKDIVWRPVAEGPQTGYEPVGENPNPAPPTSSTHGDPGVVTGIGNPKHGSCPQADRFRSLSGSASRAVAGGPEVTVALRKSTPSGCRWWSHKRQELVPGDCEERKWFRAKVDDSDYLWKWRYRLTARLPKGKYMAWSYGTAEPTHLGRNQVAFRLR